MNRYIGDCEKVYILMNLQKNVEKYNKYDIILLYIK